jgi:hypothetical protein
MATAAQITTNQNNAAHSPEPKTPKGKTTAARNSTKLRSLQRPRPRGPALLCLRPLVREAHALKHVLKTWIAP